MTTLKFKTNINCGGCKAKVSNLLNDEKNIQQWSVDTDNPEKILTVEGENINENFILTTIAKAGFKGSIIA
jgi:copper chaperone